jgi:dihydroorotate dehydrogenase (NAD+) catalytic subunit
MSPPRRGRDAARRERPRRDRASREVMNGGAMVDLSVAIGPMRLALPVLAASGTFGYGDEYVHEVPPDSIGAVITKTVTLNPRAGNPPSRTAETAGGMLNSIGLENVGLARFRAEKLPKLRELGWTVVASVGGETPHELARLVESLATEPGIAGFEINFSCPNVARGGSRYWAVPARLEKTLRALRPLTQLALIAKLSPDVTSVPDLAIACEQGGADAVTAVNTFVGMAIDIEHRRSKLGRPTGGLSGPAIKPLALARCWETARAVRIPVIGSGGILNGRDALEFIAVGASAVQVGTASFVRPRAAREVVAEMREWLEAHGIHRLSEWRGTLEFGLADDTAPALDESFEAPAEAGHEFARSDEDGAARSGATGGGSTPKARRGAAS